MSDSIIVELDNSVAAKTSAVAAASSASSAATSAASALSSANLATESKEVASTAASSIQSMLESGTYSTSIAQLALEESTGYGVISGYGATVSNGVITVGAGIVHLGNGYRYSTASTTFTPTADTTNPRYDLIYISSTGVVNILTGTAATSPTVPSVPTGGLVLWSSLITTTGGIVLTDLRTYKPRYQNAGVINVKDLGAVGDGVTDDTAAFVTAINMATDKTLLIPVGNYNINKNLFTDNVRRIYDDGFYVNIKPVYNNSTKLWQGNLGASEIVAKVERVHGGTVQGMTYNPSLNIFLVGTDGRDDGGDGHTYIETYNGDTFAKLNTYQHDELTHVNSLDYIASENRIITGNELYLSADGATLGGSEGVRDGVICYDKIHKLYFMTYGSRLVDVRNYDNSVVLKTIDTSIYTEITDTMLNGMVPWNDELIVSGTQENKLYFFNMKNGLTYEGTVTIPAGEFEDLCIKGDYLYAITAAGLVVRLPLNISVGVYPSPRYLKGESISELVSVYAGHVTNDTKSLAFYIPLPKPVVASAIEKVQVSFSGIFIRQNGYIVEGESSSIFNIGVDVQIGGLYVVLGKKDGTNFGGTNNIVCSIEIRGLMIEFT